MPLFVLPLFRLLLSPCLLSIRCTTILEPAGIEPYSIICIVIAKLMLKIYGLPYVSGPHTRSHFVLLRQDPTTRVYPAPPVVHHRAESKAIETVKSNRFCV
ncbi:uncharacterized protein BDW70DRAFT_25710 [Aspergillus foveolatus]|uniref:uncharacterized protein n=1 Tax=Aspergillus foveolatus TaxID=210207 RepID=UPI003CCD4FF8